jgi:hypothetical protein
MRKFLLAGEEENITMYGKTLYAASEYSSADCHVFCNDEVGN